MLCVIYKQLNSALFHFRAWSRQFLPGRKWFVTLHLNSTRFCVPSLVITWLVVPFVWVCIITASVFPELLSMKRSEVEVCWSWVVGISVILNLNISGSVLPIPSDVTPNVAADVSTSVLKDPVVHRTAVSVSVLNLLIVCSSVDSVVSVFVDCCVSDVFPKFSKYLWLFRSLLGSYVSSFACHDCRLCRS